MGAWRHRVRRAADRSRGCTSILKIENNALKVKRFMKRFQGDVRDFCHLGLDSRAARTPGVDDCLRRRAGDDRASGAHAAASTPGATARAARDALYHCPAGWRDADERGDDLAGRDARGVCGDGGWWRWALRAAARGAGGAASHARTASICGGISRNLVLYDLAAPVPSRGQIATCWCHPA